VRLSALAFPALLRPVCGASSKLPGAVLLRPGRVGVDLLLVRARNEREVDVDRKPRRTLVLREEEEVVLRVEESMLDAVFPPSQGLIVSGVSCTCKARMLGVDALWARCVARPGG